MDPRAKISTKKGSPATALELDVAKALIDIESSPTCDFKGDLKAVTVYSAQEVEVKAGRKCIIVHIPARVWKSVQKVQGRLIHELEKKFSGKHVILIAQRTILDTNYRRKGIKVRPRTRTLTSVQEAILDDIVAPVDISGKRTKFTTDNQTILKVILDAKDKDRDILQDKLDTFAFVYTKLTNKPAVFAFEA
jgi:small subunit ribosomal protein S7e